MKNRVAAAAFLALAFGILLVPERAHAVSQWSRKYGVACSHCHTAAFPRVNYFGEQFMWNGYQDIGTQDGDTQGKQPIGERLFIDDVANLFGFRINVIPLRVQTEGLERTPGDFRTSVRVGNADWLQVFTAGSIFKNASIFIETEFNSAGEIHNAWFRAGVHNLFGTSLLNVWAGLLNPLDLHSTQGRLPMIPPIRQEAFYVLSSGGTGDESVSLRGGRPGIHVYGYRGPFLYSVGIDNGPNLQDTNLDKNYWVTLRGNLPFGPLAGSNVTVWGYRGVDSRNILDTADVYQGRAKNTFWRLVPGVNLRWRSLDVLGAWTYGYDENWTLGLSGEKQSNTFHGLFGQVGYTLLGGRVHAAAQYDQIWSEQSKRSVELAKVAVALSYLPRENWRLMLVPRIDVLPESSDHPRRSHDIYIALRSMF